MSDEMTKKDEQPQEQQSGQNQGSEKQPKKPMSLRTKLLIGVGTVVVLVILAGWWIHSRTYETRTTRRSTAI